LGSLDLERREKEKVKEVGLLLKKNEGEEEGVVLKL